MSGRWRAIETGPCPNGPPKGQVWFNVKVKVVNLEASVYINEQLVASYKTHYAAKGQGGVFLWLGYKNIAEFKNFNIKRILYPANSKYILGHYGSKYKKDHLKSNNSKYIP